jgi:8-oxo-dGTP diphosphatase
MALNVVAAVLVAHNGTILIQQRPADKMHGGLWEFPGGKREPGEQTRLALVRELEEELAIAVNPDDLMPLCFSVEPRGDVELVLLLFRCDIWTGDPVPLDGAALRWVQPSNLADYPMPPADRPLAQRLTELLTA